ncbi:hypothetical protein F01_230106 [Burkholderia cenocepacia]|nr:hypothetical protein F01_230106 [Burkholderia cenocepacia]
MFRRDVLESPEIWVQRSNIPHYEKRSHNSKILLRGPVHAHYNPLELARSRPRRVVCTRAILTFQDPGDENVRCTERSDEICRRRT